MFWYLFQYIFKPFLNIYLYFFPKQYSLFLYKNGIKVGESHYNSNGGIDLFYIKPEYQKKGYGRELFKLTIDELKKLNAQNALCWLNIRYVYLFPTNTSEKFWIKMNLQYTNFGLYTITGGGFWGYI